MRLALALATVAALAPAAASAQAYQCRAQSAIPRPHPDLPSESQPARRLPIGGYTLSLTWSPGYCRDNADRPGSAFQCGRGNAFGFTLHGLWPDGVGKDWPQYCRATGLLPRRTIAAHLCATPSPQLLQHEWAKHGTCMAGYTPDRYFARSNALYRRLRYPDMDALSRAPLTAAGLAQSMARANPGLGPDMMRITTDKEGWLDEVWLCLDRSFAYRRCPAHQGGLAPTASVRIWRGRR